MFVIVQRLRRRLQTPAFVNYCTKGHGHIIRSEINTLIYFVVCTK